MNNASKGAVLHDYIATIEGGAQLASHLAISLQWELITSSMSNNIAANYNRDDLILKQLGKDYPKRLLRPLMALNRWRNFKSSYQTLIYSGNYTPLAAPNHTKVTNIFYCHSPARFLFDQADHFSTQIPLIYKSLYRLLLNFYRKQYLHSINHMDIILVNSVGVQKRVTEFLGKPSSIVYPPCNVNAFHSMPDEGYYLSTARLDPLKRVDLIIKAFINLPGKKLIVASDGPERKNLERLANKAKNIKFVGIISDTHLKDLLSRCIATIYIPIDEDFGMSPVESMAAGKPVIGVAEGGLLETIVHKETGFLLQPNPNTEEICDVISLFTSKFANSMSEACKQRARKFDITYFKIEIKKVIDLLKTSSQ